MIKAKNIYDLSREHGIGYIKSGKIFYFDLEDYDKIFYISWCEDKDGYMVNRNNNFRMHRLVMNCPKNMQIDHINHVVYDNRKNNLRIVNVVQNQRNRILSSNNTSGVNGVWFVKRDNIWRASICVEKKRIALGSFKDIEDAIESRKNAEIKYFGEYMNIFY
jgi:hypothetical protein